MKKKIETQELLKIFEFIKLAISKRYQIGK